MNPELRPGHFSNRRPLRDRRLLGAAIAGSSLLLGGVLTLLGDGGRRGWLYLVAGMIVLILTYVRSRESRGAGEGRR
jgi:hypothetical protein